MASKNVQSIGELLRHQVFETHSELNQTHGMRRKKYTKKTDFISSEISPAASLLKALLTKTSLIILFVFGSEVSLGEKTQNVFSVDTRI